MKTEYLRTASNSYMIIKEAEYLFEPYELQMVLRNRMEHLLPLQIMISDGKTEYWYDVTGMQSLEQKLNQQTAGEELVRKVAEEICGLKTELEEFLLQDSDIVYLPEKIFVDRKTKTVRFCYIPGAGTEKHGSVRGLLERFLQRLDHSDAAAIRLAYGLYERCGTDDLELKDYYECLYEKTWNNLEKEPAYSDESEEISVEPLRYRETYRKEPVNDETELEEIKVNSSAHKQRKYSELLHQKKRHRWFHREKRKTAETISVPYQIEAEERQRYMVAEQRPEEHWEETVCFPISERKESWVLDYRGDGVETDLQLNHFPYRIGKHGSHNVEGKLYAQTVSRMHAQITTDENKNLWISDFNSTNGTYLNGHLIPMNTPMQIKEGDHIIFATEEYVLERV